MKEKDEILCKVESIFQENLLVRIPFYTTYFYHLV